LQIVWPIFLSKKLAKNLGQKGLPKILIKTFGQKFLVEKFGLKFWSNIWDKKVCQKLKKNCQKF
jgi:hypothetical protein